MTIEKQPTFKFNIGDMVSGHKHGVGKGVGVITGRTILTMGTPLYWVRTRIGQEFKIPQHQIRGGANE